MGLFKSKKRLFSILVPIFLLTLGGALFAIKTQFAEDPIGKLQVFKGSAQITTGSTTITGLSGTPIHLKDQIKVASDSTVAVILEDNTIIRLEGGSQAEIEQLSYREDGKIKEAVIKLDNGRLWSRVQPVQNGSKFEVETPTITAAVRGTSFNTTFKNQITGIYVYHHKVEVTLDSSGDNQNIDQTKLLQMKQDSLKSDFDKGSSLPPDGFFDDWIKFNQAEDDRLCEQLHDIPEDCGESVPSLTKPKTTPKKTTTPAATTPNYYVAPAPTPIPVPVTLTNVAVSCAYTDFDYPNTSPVPCTAKAKYSNGKTKDVTSTAQWTDSPAVGGFQYYNGFMDYYATYVTGDNLVTVKASYDGKTGSIVINTQALG